MKTNPSTTRLFKLLKESQTLDQAIDGVPQNISLIDYLRARLEQAEWRLKGNTKRYAV